MGYLKRLFGLEQKQQGTSHPTGMSLSEQLYRVFLMGDMPSTRSGKVVSIDSAMDVSTVFACVRVISEGVAQPPLKLFHEKDDGGREVAKAHPLHKLIYRKPNDFQTSFEFRETMTMHAALSKGGYAFINWIDGRPVELIPMMPQCIKVTQNDDWTLKYEWRRKPESSQVKVMKQNEVLHIRGMSWNGYTAEDVVRKARESIGLAMATEDHSARLARNGTRLGGLLLSKSSLTSDEVRELREQWEETHGGSDNAYKTAILGGGMDYKTMSINNVDAQHDETRMRQIEEICRYFRVFPTMIGYSDKAATYASVEQFMLAHVLWTLGPWYERWEQALNMKCLSEDEYVGGFYCKFMLQGLLRGDSVARASFYNSAITNGWMTRNEVRGLEELNPIDGLDVPLIPLNMGDGRLAPTSEENQKLLRLWADTARLLAPPTRNIKE